MKYLQLYNESNEENEENEKNNIATRENSEYHCRKEWDFTCLRILREPQEDASAGAGESDEGNEKKQYCNLSIFVNFVVKKKDSQH